MSMKMVRKTYGTQKNILAMAGDWHAIERDIPQNSPLAVVEDGRKIVKIGTPYPSNDASCIGLVFNDYDVTDGDVVASILIDGKVEERKLPVALTSAAKAALKANGLIIFPMADITVQATLEAVAVDVDAGLTSGDFSADVLMNGQIFREGAVPVLSNWTISGEGATKLTVKEVEYLNESTVRVYFSVETGETTAVGNLTIVPKAAAVGNGVIPATAAKIAVVA